ncbi:CPBP family intramembrane metalloprotease [Mitsuaria sp. GD03876]|uniref:CPBP family intramembrane glutamic endopeptidase n=1 Tax=Mitsuaria sp. GD03876 TaxID=2975399 RepID=UPI002448A697|nr:CPBP family intramembrane metalloprotease [Mitsuaria sp. GD03876]MDH0867717.1 CPBP family intramembrane metalloprotease [Mitsuaria sp. GD03876]
MPLSHLLLCLSIAATLLPVRAPWPWFSLLIMAVTAGLLHGQLTVAAMVPVAAMAALAWMALAARHRPRREAVLMLLMLVVGLALALHVLPGFQNPTFLVAASDLRPPSPKYLNFDKGVAGMLMLAVLMQRQRRRPDGAFGDARGGAPAPVPSPGLPWVALPAAIVATLALPWLLAVAGGVGVPALRWPDNAALFLSANLLLTCVAEEAAFRGVIQGLLARRLGTDLRTWRGWLPVLVAAVLFGLAHAAGGPAYVALATLAGVGYGLVYALSGRIEAAIGIHFALNALVFLTLNTRVG